MASIGDRNERDVRSHLTILRARFGVDGRDRRRWMEEHLHRIAELSIPMHFRVLLEHCEDSNETIKRQAILPADRRRGSTAGIPELFFLRSEGNLAGDET